VSEPSAGDTVLPGGSIGDWLDDITAVLEQGAESAVPCGDCSACCTASQFIHIEPDEARALARIPSDLLFPAPGLPDGHVLMGYDQRGHCPMLVEGRCSIYEDRPRTCRAYDCRIFAVTGVPVDEPQKRAVAARVAQWRFSASDPDDDLRWSAVRAAVAFLGRLEAPEGVPAMAQALAALRIHRLFYGPEGLVEPDPDAVLAVLRAGDRRRG
jgi:hypothetical protein